MRVDTMSYRVLVETLVQYLQSKRYEKCEGLPLAIVILRGLMSSKKSSAEWKSVHDSLNWELSNNTKLELVKTITFLSYRDLPFQLKQCFLYCCMFPKDYEIHRKRLIRLWMAEGFVEQFKDVPPEVVAESYLMDLINRRLLQVIWRNHFGRPKSFKMHDLVREFALSVSKEEKIVAVSDGEKGVEENGICRYSIEVKGKLLNLHTLFLKRAKIEKLPYEIVKLRNLRHLNASYLEITEIDYHLESLQCVSVPSNVLSSVPEVPLNMDAFSSAPPYLEKLLLVGKLEKVPRWFNTLLNLNSLSLQKSELGEDLISSLQEFPNLMSLHLSGNAFQGESLRFVEGFQKLKGLRVQNCPLLNEIVIEKGVMRSLQKLLVLGCKGLRKMPYGWKRLIHLKEMLLYVVSDELVESICGKGNGNLPEVPYIILNRTDDDDGDEVKSKWVHKILN
ncbi:hypothetical protein PTKIN_Ptkin11bG0066900 [Pterospermum kingtungense]